MKRVLLLLLLGLAAPGAHARGTAAPEAPLSIDAFEASSAWTALPASGVLMKLTTEPGPNGNALRVDFDFQKGGGYAVIHRAVDLALPENYRFEFRVRGETAPQNLEFKLADSTGENVWWRNDVNHEFAREWTTERIRKRQISYAWGPLGGGELRRARSLEFAITAGSGGKGTVWFDDLTLVPLPVPVAPPEPVASASSDSRAHPAGAALDSLPGSWWQSRPGDRTPAWTMDLGTSREFGGLVLDWHTKLAAADYDIQFDDGNGQWRTVRGVRGGDGGRDWLDLRESETRRVRVRALAKGAVGLDRVQLMPLAWSGSAEQFWMNVAADAPRGHYPRGFSHEQSYWTVTGVDGDREEGLFDEDARLETGRAQWSLEPFLRTEQGLRTWADGTAEQSLAQGWMPIPTTTRTVDSLSLAVTAFAFGEAGKSALGARYHVRDLSGRARRVVLYVAIRPFQVNPPSQFLNVPGGPARIESLRRDGADITVNGTRHVRCITPPEAWGALRFDSGELVAKLAADAPPRAEAVTDPQGRASGVLEWRLDLAAHGEREIQLVVPFGDTPAPLSDTLGPLPRVQAGVEQEWAAKLGDFSFEAGGSGADVAATLKAQLAYVLVNRDGAGIQPGSRSYERSWIRDGSLTSSALLRCGMTEPVKQFLLWYAEHQYADGKVPCCVDRRGSDPVPEHDSHGEFVFLAAEYLRLTGDRATAERVWPNVRAAVAYQDSLRAQRRTPEWRTPENAPYFGLLPPSISHEGYSAKPMHSYWDDLFALRGYKDGVWLAQQLGHPEDARWMTKSRDEFAHDFAAAVRAAMAVHKIDYIPGCSDLGDFDATSTTIALSPVLAGGPGGVLADASLRATFERYWGFFKARRDNHATWDAYTPYELRNVGAFVRLGWRDRVRESLDWFLLDRRPQGFRHWAEVVDSMPRRPRFLGDMPHTWVGTDFVRSVQEMLAYEEEADSSLVLAAGVPSMWLWGAGVRVRGLRTRWGVLGYDYLVSHETTSHAGVIEFRLTSHDLKVPPGGLFLTLPEKSSRWSRFSAIIEWSDGSKRELGDQQGPLRLDVPGMREVPTRVLLFWRSSGLWDPYR